MKMLMLVSLLVLALAAGIAGLLIAFGGPADLKPMPSIGNPFSRVDYSGLPAPSRFAARDGSMLEFRTYRGAGGTPKGAVVLVHGSSANATSMHVLAKAFAGSGMTAYAIDVRGHGGSGTRGRIAYVGQLEDDVEDFVRAVPMPSPVTLVGFSSGGGFVLRFAGSARQKLFASYLLLSPFIGQDSPTYRRQAGGWVSVGFARNAVITLLDAVGVHVFNDLPVTKFAVADGARAALTSQYSFALAQNFRPQPDYRANIRSLGQPLRLLAGRDDEVFIADRFEAVFRAEGKAVPVTLLPGIGHIALTLEPVAVDAAVAAVQQLNATALARSAPVDRDVPAVRADTESPGVAARVARAPAN